MNFGPMQPPPPGNCFLNFGAAIHYGSPFLEQGQGRHPNHSTEGYNNVNNNHQTHGQRKEKHPKTEMCRSYVLLGACPYLDACTFAHGLDELGSRDYPTILFKRERCKNQNETGTCHFGTRCRFIHDEIKFQLNKRLTILYSRGEEMLRGVMKAKQTRDPPNDKVFSHSNFPFQGLLRAFKCYGDADIQLFTDASKTEFTPEAIKQLLDNCQTVFRKPIASWSFIDFAKCLYFLRDDTPTNPEEAEAYSQIYSNQPEDNTSESSNVKPYFVYATPPRPQKTQLPQLVPSFNWKDFPPNSPTNFCPQMNGVPRPKLSSMSMVPPMTNIPFATIPNNPSTISDTLNPGLDKISSSSSEDDTQHHMRNLKPPTPPHTQQQQQFTQAPVQQFVFCSPEHTLQCGLASPLHPSMSSLFQTNNVSFSPMAFSQNSNSMTYSLPVISPMQSPSNGNLLDLAPAHGLNLEFSPQRTFHRQLPVPGLAMEANMSSLHGMHPMSANVQPPNVHQTPNIHISLEQLNKSMHDLTLGKNNISSEGQPGSENLLLVGVRQC